MGLLPFPASLSKLRQKKTLSYQDHSTRTCEVWCCGVFITFTFTFAVGYEGRVTMRRVVLRERDRVRVGERGR